MKGVLSKNRPKRDCSGGRATLRFRQKTPKTPFSQIKTPAGSVELAGAKSK
jgi:hypothetical protein